eukprot:m.105744 g.105744  ORF g.105744 m.105744 type:complete len:170 (-) comp13285_c0_seq3:1760-2269(-)
MAELNGAYGYGNLTPHTARKPRFQTAQKTSDTDGGKTDATAAPMLSAVKLNAQAKASHANAQQHHSTRRSGSTAESQRMMPPNTPNRKPRQATQSEEFGATSFALMRGQPLQQDVGGSTRRRVAMPSSLSQQQQPELVEPRKLGEVEFGLTESNGSWFSLFMDYLLGSE